MFALGLVGSILLFSHVAAVTVVFFSFSIWQRSISSGMPDEGVIQEGSPRWVRKRFADANEKDSSSFHAYL